MPKGESVYAGSMPGVDLTQFWMPGEDSYLFLIDLLNSVTTTPPQHVIRALLYITDDVPPRFVSGINELYDAIKRAIEAAV